MLEAASWARCRRRARHNAADLWEVSGAVLSMGGGQSHPSSAARVRELGSPCACQLARACLRSSVWSVEAFGGTELWER